MGRFKWYLSLLSPSSTKISTTKKRQKQKKKNVARVGPPPTKLAGSTHDILIIFVFHYHLWFCGSGFRGAVLNSVRWMKDARKSYP